MDSPQPMTPGFRLENFFYPGIPLVLLALSAVTLSLQAHVHLHNPRLQYGITQLPEALLQAALITATAGLLRLVLARMQPAHRLPTAACLGALVIAFCLCWLPVLLRGRFVQDDWMLLSAATIRKVIYVHPSYAWFSLDTVDGNFRPLGTTLYFAYMLKFFGANAVAFLSGNFAVNLAGSLMAYFLVRELGYSRTAGAAASLLYMTRGLNYTPIAWACALGDGIVVLLGALILLAVLRANRQTGPSVFAYHAIAWVLLWIAALAKQSAFAIPLIIALALLLRPGQDILPALRRRVVQAIAALVFYSVPAAVIFLHAKTLLRHGTPYPISITFASFVQWLAYIPWYFIAIPFPGKYKILIALTILAGAAILVAIAVFVKRVPRVLGRRPRDIAFLLLASLAAISLYAVVPTRTAPYYGAMSAFWVSLAVGIALTQFGGIADRSPSARNAYFALYLLLVAGALDIRLKETGLIPSGGYIWGTYGMDTQNETYHRLQEILANSPASHTLVLVNFPNGAKFQTSMALFADPSLTRILVFDPKTRTFLSNDLSGGRPQDGFAALNDPEAYNWDEPVNLSAENGNASPSHAIWIEFDGQHAHQIQPMTAP